MKIMSNALSMDQPQHHLLNLALTLSSAKSVEKLIQSRSNMYKISLNRRVLLLTASIFVVYILYIIVVSTADRAANNLLKSNAQSYRDWNDYQFMAYEASRIGPGEHGDAFYLDDPQEIQLNDFFIEKTGFGALVSDKISVNRSLPRVVHADCMDIKYPTDLPKVSIIIIFHNEVLSVLLRTIHSIYNRTPKELLHEIILVNDHSNELNHYSNLPAYLTENFPEKNLIKLRNLPKRSGLIVARMEGARAASGQVLVFFDSHVEVQSNWLPPLLAPLIANPKIATMPIIDYFDCRTFEYYPGQEHNQGTRGIVDWFLNFHELSKLPKDQEHPLRPFPNPIMLGCAFAIDRKFFVQELGGYDEELRIWNGENYELSFKLWMCRSGLYTVPCSRVAHSFRDINPSRQVEDDFVARNFKRIAEVWLDEFKELLYEREPHRYRTLDPGDLTRQRKTRRDLGCRPFRWFLRNVAPDMVDKYPPVTFDIGFASGAVQSVANPRLCLDNLGKLFDGRIGIEECGNDLVEPGVNQKFRYSFYKDLRQTQKQREYCLDAYNLNMYDCNEENGGNQLWIYSLNTKQISQTNEDTSVTSCIAVNLQNSTIHLEKCNENDTQKWTFGYVNYTAFERFDEIFGYAGVVTIKDL